MNSKLSCRKESQKTPGQAGPPGAYRRAGDPRRQDGQFLRLFAAIPSPRGFLREYALTSSAGAICRLVARWRMRQAMPMTISWRPGRHTRLPAGPREPMRSPRCGAGAEMSAPTPVLPVPRPARPTKRVPRQPSAGPAGNIPATADGWWPLHPKPTRCRRPGPCRHSGHRRGVAALSVSWPKASCMARSRSCWRSAGASLFRRGRYFSTINVLRVFFSATMALAVFTLGLSDRRRPM